MIEITRLGTQRDRLGEGPLWDPQTARLFWVDSMGGTLYANDLAGGATRTWPLPQKIGSLAVVDDSTVVVALEQGVYRFDLETAALELCCAPPPDDRLRFNDGKTDRQGRFLTGTMGARIRTEALSALYRFDPPDRLVELHDDIIVTNGPCFSPAGDVFYFTDGRRRILTCPYDTATGTLGAVSVHIDMTALDTASDGATVDADGCLWTALVGSGEIGRFDPDGALMQRIEMPQTHPSSVAFVGPNLDRLAVTSISDSGNRTALGEHDGGLYLVDGLDATGLPEARLRWP